MQPKWAIAQLSSQPAGSAAIEGQIRAAQKDIVRRIGFVDQGDQWWRIDLLDKAHVQPGGA
jgi:hypothetical protein